MGSEFIHRLEPGNRTALLLLHGTGGSENDLIDLGHTLLPKATLLSPRGNVSENGMARFFRRFSEGVFDEEDVIRRTDELADFIGNMRKENQWEKVIAAGYSNGANIAASLLLLRPEVLQGAVLFRAMTPLRPDQLPDLAGCPVFLAAGRYDSLMPVESVDELAGMLRSAGADLELRWAECGHRLEPEEIEAARQWLARQVEQGDDSGS